jgi:hypothetical protein
MVSSEGGLDVPWYGFDWFASCAPNATAVAAKKAYTNMVRFILISSRRARFRLHAVNPAGREKSPCPPGKSDNLPKLSVTRYLRASWGGSKAGASRGKNQ